MKPHVVILTGAGISAESGLNTFRDNDGLWEKHRVEDVATPEAFERDPAAVYRFYNLRRQQLQQPDVRPNAAHVALAELEAEMGERCLVVTQNVDNLHERAGSRRVIHMHGELLSARCILSGKAVHYTGNFDGTTGCHCCDPPGALRPDIVWFGEVPMHMDKIGEALAAADIFIAIGTSGQVYPAAGFVQLAKQYGAKTVELNIEAPTRPTDFDEFKQGPASQVVPAFIQNLLEGN
ncbi:Sir2 family NAD+-dependent deacetylase [Salinimonas chungwhensis]|uniref:Sir2 family NAD+-dependent deacetylase n=1 Tax=Salinimonas chungwhensis TaxID=265425 RepID=UPI000363A682|nr:Sir2 family NAD+-dependent deacetylase [Salinimonas chungwhensis]